MGLVHGRMKPSEKDEVMNAFHNGNISLLVSTTVIEVGVNVPNATICVLKGLSDLAYLNCISYVAV